MTEIQFEKQESRGVGEYFHSRASPEPNKLNHKTAGGHSRQTHQECYPPRLNFLNTPFREPLTSPWLDNLIHSILVRYYPERYSITLFLILCFLFPASERHREHFGFFAFQVRCSDTKVCFACGSTDRYVSVCPFYCLHVASIEKEIQTIRILFPRKQLLYVVKQKAEYTHL